jgi:hypothetical protein
MSLRDSTGKGYAGSARSRNQEGNRPLLRRKAVLMGMLTSGFVIANAAQPNSASAGTLKAVATTQLPYAPKWTPSTPYVLGQQVISPTNDVVSANVTHTSSAGYATDTAKWTLSSTFASKTTETTVSSGRLSGNSMVASFARRDSSPSNVRDYGALGDGTADDSAAIQAAINAAVSAGGGLIWFPSGNYLIGTTILVYNATKIVLQGQGVLQNNVSSAPMFRFRNVTYCGSAPTLQWIGNWRPNAIALELDGSLYGDFAVRGDQWPTGINVITSALATQNSACNDLAMDIANGINGMVFRGNGSHYASNNRISRFTWGSAGSGSPIGINFTEYTDNNICNWAYVTLNVSSAIGVIYNSANPTSDNEVYENHFDYLILEGYAAGTIGIKGNKTSTNGARTSFIRYRLSGTALPTNSIATICDIQFINSGNGITAYAGKEAQSGAGAPNTLTGMAGQYYLRTDTPTIANQRIYICTVSGGAGAATWVGIL